MRNIDTHETYHWDRISKAMRTIQEVDMLAGTNIDLRDDEPLTASQETKPVSGATKYDADKPDVSLVSPEFILGVAEVMTFGANKYGKRNYMTSQGDTAYYDRLYSACQRHLLAYQMGEKMDPESGRPHIFHAVSNLLMLVDMEAHKDA